MIYVGVVKSNYDTTRSGKFWVECKELGYNPCEIEITKEGKMIRKGKCLKVTYTTPYFKNFKTGMITVPEEGSQVLIVVKDKGIASAYYLSTIVAEEGAVKRSVVENSIREDPYMNPLEFYEDGAPAAQTFKSAKNNGLGIYFKASKTRYVNKTTLNNGNKELSLDSSPEVDCVKLNNGHGDYIKITGIPEPAPGGPPLHPGPRRSLEARTFLNQHFVSDRGELDFKVIDGKEITLENRSSGFFSWGSLFGPRAGNVNLFSKYKNINITAKAPNFVPSEGFNSGGKIMIQTSNSEIIVSRDGVTIQLNPLGTTYPFSGFATAGFSKPKIELKALTGDIVIDAGSYKNTPLEGGSRPGGRLILKGGTIELDSTNGVFINGGPTGSINLASTTTVNIGGAAAVNIDGALVNLNSGASVAGVGATQAITATPSVPPINVTPSEYPTGTKYF